MLTVIAAFGHVANDLAPLVFGVCGVVALVYVGRALRRSRSEGLTPPDGTIYAGFVRASVRDERRPGAFTTMKNGIGGTLLTVAPNSIEVAAVGGGFSRLARLLGVRYAANPAEVTMSTTEVGWAGTLLASKGSVVLTGGGARHRQLALYPFDGDLARLQAALEDVGVTVVNQPVET